MSLLSIWYEDTLKVMFHKPRNCSPMKIQMYWSTWLAILERNSLRCKTPKLSMLQILLKQFSWCSRRNFTEKSCSSVTLVRLNHGTIIFRERKLQIQLSSLQVYLLRIHWVQIGLEIWMCMFQISLHLNSIDI